MTSTPIRHLPDADLLRLVLGDEAAATLTDLPLADVFRFDAGTAALQEEFFYERKKVLAKFRRGE